MNERIASLAARLSAFAQRKAKWRGALLALAACLFLAGGAISLRDLQLDAASIDGRAIGLIIFVMAPLCLSYGGLSMMLMARAAGVRLTFAACLRIASFAQLAELLPIPGGAIVRGGALMRGGASLGHSTRHVLANALLWIGLSAFAAGLAIAPGAGVGWLFVGGGAALGALSLGWIAHQAGAGLAIASLALRAAGLGLAAARLAVAFAALSIYAPFQDMFVFAFASIAGSAASIAPGGLGISEALAAALANFTSTLPAAAFTAVALVRILDLAFNALFTFVFPLLAGRGVGLAATIEPRA